MSVDKVKSKQSRVPITIDSLIIKLGDASSEIQTNAADLLGQLGHKAVSELRKAIIDNNAPEKRQYAVIALKIIGKDAFSAVPELKIALVDSSFTVRWRAAEALGAIGPKAKEAIPELVTALDDEQSAVREYAAQTLGKLGRSAVIALPKLRQLIDTDQDSDVRNAVLKTFKLLSNDAK